MRSSTMPHPHPHRRRSGAARTLTILFIVLGSAGLTGSLTGCITGDGAAGEFGRLLADDPIVEEFELSSADNMPFTGGVSGVVELSDDASDGQVRDLSERIVEFATEDELRAEDHRADQPARVRVDLLIDEWRFPVLTEPASQQTLVNLILDQRLDTSLTSGSISSHTYRSDVTHVSLHLTDGTDAFAALEDASNQFSEAGMSPVVAVAGTSADERSIELEGSPGPWVETARQSYDALGARVPLTEFTAGADIITVTVGSEHDAPRAAAILESELSGSEIAAYVQSEFLSLAPEATGEAARAVFASMDATAFTSLESAWSNDRRLQLQVDAIDHVDAVVEALAQNTDAARLESIQITVGPSDDPVFRVESPAIELPDAQREAQAQDD